MKTLSARAWAVAGLALLLGRASVSLFFKGYREVLDPPLLSNLEWGALALIVVLFAWGEGWMALHRKWAPRVAGRMRAIDERTPPHLLVFAPLHAVGLVGAPRRTLVRTWAGAGAIVVAIVAVRQMAQPWQGMIKLGVSLALAIGVVSLVGRAVDGAVHSPDLPPHPNSAR